MCVEGIETMSSRRPLMTVQGKVVSVSSKPSKDDAHVLYNPVAVTPRKFNDQIDKPRNKIRASIKICQMTWTRKS